MHELLLSDIQTPSLADSKAGAPKREWLGRLALDFKEKKQKTVLSRVQHLGPLRVQKPFYPEDNGTCHVYILHPPGGMVLGDSLNIKASLAASTQVLLTTPSAGKFYGVKQHVADESAQQYQIVELNVGASACLEWLPQETIVFDSAKGNIKTRINVEANSRYFVWDIVRLGRAASGEKFTQGQCRQSLEIWQSKKPKFIERNVFKAGSELCQAHWGLQGANTSATLVASLQTSRETLEAWLLHVQQQYSAEGLWGLTQKQDVFIARYLGSSVSQCRAGFEYLWQQSRTLLNNAEAVSPRIWRT